MGIEEQEGFGFKKLKIVFDNIIKSKVNFNKVRIFGKISPNPR